MRQHDTDANVHVPKREQSHAPVLRRPQKRREVRAVEEGAQQLRHGLDNPRPFQMPPQRKKPAHRKSYSIAGIVLTIIVIFCVLSVVWGYAISYQIGYHAAEHYFTEVVRHG